MGCMQNMQPDETVCPCGFDERRPASLLAVRPRTWLTSRYLAGRVLGEPGGFGVTYLGWDAQLERMIAIKEFLPRDLAGRATTAATVFPHSEKEATLFRYGLDRFLEEARTLAKFDNAHIVRVQDFFEANGTAYLVMPYYPGLSLSAFLAESGGRLPSQAAVGILMPILDALREVHAKAVLHRDIKPQNIYLTDSSLPILLDFGAARAALGERSRSMSAILTEGFAPFEQYGGGQQGPWTDVYAAAATLYCVVTGKVPTSAIERKIEDTIERPDAIAPVSKELSDAIMAGLAVDWRQRPQTVSEWQLRFRDSVGGPGDRTIRIHPVDRRPPAGEPITTRGSADATQNSAAPGRRSAFVAAGGATVLAVGVAVAWFAQRPTPNVPREAVGVTESTPPVGVRPISIEPASRPEPPPAERPDPATIEPPISPSTVDREPPFAPARESEPPPASQAVTPPREEPVRPAEPPSARPSAPKKPRPQTESNLAGMVRNPARAPASAPPSPPSQPAQEEFQWGASDSVKVR